jgi:hypothetical protein
MNGRWLAMATLSLLGACGTEISEVHVRIRRGSCLDSDLVTINGVYVRLQRRGAAMSFQGCRNTFRELGQLEALEGKTYLGALTLDHVPTEGTWDFRVAGFGRNCDALQDPLDTLLCGESIGLSMPPPDDQVVLTIDCRPDLSSGLTEQFKACGAATLGVKP